MFCETCHYKYVEYLDYVEPSVAYSDNEATAHRRHAYTNVDKIYTDVV